MLSNCSSRAKSNLFSQDMEFKRHSLLGICIRSNVELLWAPFPGILLYLLTNSLCNTAHKWGNYCISPFWGVTLHQLAGKNLMMAPGNSELSRGEGGPAHVSGDSGHDISVRKKLRVRENLSGAAANRILLCPLTTDRQHYVHFNFFSQLLNKQFQPCCKC